MKEYKYKINGTVYNVTVGDIVNNMAEVEVNGTTYKVEMEQNKENLESLCLRQKKMEFQIL